MPDFPSRCIKLPETGDRCYSAANSRIILYPFLRIHKNQCTLVKKWKIAVLTRYSYKGFLGLQRKNFPGSMDLHDALLRNLQRISRTERRSYVEMQQNQLVFLFYS